MITKQSLLNATALLLAAVALAVGVLAFATMLKVDRRLSEHEALLQGTIAGLNQSVRQVDQGARAVIDWGNKVVARASVAAETLDNTMAQATTSAGQFTDAVKTSATVMDHSTDLLSRQVLSLTQTAGELKSIYAPQPAVLEQLGQFERRISQPAAWPGSKTEAEKLRGELKDFTGHLSPLVQDALAPRLIPLRWSVQALATLRANGSAENAAPEEREKSYDSLLQAEPEGAPKALHEAVLAGKQAAQQRAAALRRSSALSNGRAALEGQDTEALSAAWTSLDRLGDRADDIQSLKGSLRAKLLSLEIKHRGGELGDQLKRVLALGDESLRQQTLVKLLDSATTYKIGLLTDAEKGGLPMVELDSMIAATSGKLQEVLDKQQKESEQKNRAYQSWALEQIKRFNETFDATDKKQGLFGWGDTGYLELQTAMTRYLVPVSVNCLEMPVARLYQKAFQRGWNKLEGRPNQLEVAKAAVQIRKRTPGDKN